MSFKDKVEEIRKTGHVHRNWYLETYPDVARLGMEPAEHYLKYGAAMGRNPGKSFNTKFYLDRYPDVAEIGMNPLLHYAHFGKKEGRLTGGDATDRKAERLLHYLWGSNITDRVISELEHVADDTSYSEEMRFEVIQKLAIRYAFDGNLPKALAHICTIPELTPGQIHEKRYLVIRAFLHLQNDEPDLARELIERFLSTSKGQDNADATLALANTCPEDSARLTLLNAVYTRAGLAPLRLRDPALPLSLGNIEGDAVPACTIDHGLVSIIMPIYNAEDMIETAIRSLCQQSYRNIEIIAVDDCSPDGTFAVLKRLAAEDPRIRPVRQEVNAGAYPARNRGLDLAKGQFIATHDADDWSHPQKIETQIKALVAGNAQGVVAHWARVRPTVHVTTNWRVTSEVLHWSHSTFLARKSLFDELGHWDTVRTSADTEFIWRMQSAYGGSSLKKIVPHAPLALALDDDNSLTRSKQTHVSTVYYGLRLFYREIAQYWHRQPGGLSPENHAKRLAMIPDEMFRKPNGPVDLDLVLHGDCSDPKVVSKMRDTLQDPAHAQHNVGIDHLPDITRLPNRFAPVFFDLLALPRVRPVVPGTEIIATQEIHIDG
jgi:glycosyl transferase family 2